MPSSRYSVRGNWFALLAIAATAVAVEIPFLHYGYPSGHDVEFHLYSWLEVLAQWKQGIVYPRWAAWRTSDTVSPGLCFIRLRPGRLAPR